MRLGAGTRRWVVKAGSALITNDGRGLESEVIGEWVAQMVALRTRGIDVVLVSSGSVAEGMSRLGLARRPEALYELQAVAAVGQMGLVQAYESCFQRHATHTAQVLLTHEDFSDRGRYLNARSTLRQLLSYRVVPVINENDAVCHPRDAARRQRQPRGPGREPGGGGAAGDPDRSVGPVRPRPADRLLGPVRRAWPGR